MIVKTAIHSAWNAIKRVKGQNGRRYIIKLYESQEQGKWEVNRAQKIYCGLLSIPIVKSFFMTLKIIS